MAIHDSTDCANSSVVIPVWVVATSWRSPFSPLAISPAMSPFSTDAKGCRVFHSG